MTRSLLGPVWTRVGRVAASSISNMLSSAAVPTILRFTSRSPWRITALIEMRRLHRAVQRALVDRPERPWLRASRHIVGRGSPVVQAIAIDGCPDRR